MAKITVVERFQYDRDHDYDSFPIHSRDGYFVDSNEIHSEFDAGEFDISYYTEPFDASEYEEETEPVQESRVEQQRVQPQPHEEEYVMTEAERYNLLMAQIEQEGEVLLGLTSFSEITLGVWAKAVMYAQSKLKITEMELRALLDAVVARGKEVFGDNFDVSKTLFQVRSSDEQYKMLIKEVYVRADRYSIQFTVDQMNDDQYTKLVQILVESLSSDIWSIFLYQLNVTRRNLTAVKYLQGMDCSEGYGIPTTDYLELLKNNIASIETSIEVTTTPLVVEEPEEIPVQPVEQPEEPERNLFEFRQVSEEDRIEAKVNEKRDTVVNEILKVIKVMYGENFMVKPLGVLSFKYGLIGYERVRGETPRNLVQYEEHQALTRTIAGVYNNTFNIQGTPYIKEYPEQTVSIEGSKVFNPDGTLKYNYFPLLHLYYVTGFISSENGTVEKNWGKMLVHITAILNNFVPNLLRYGLLKGFDEELLEYSIKEIFTNIIFIKELSRTKSLSMTSHLQVMKIKAENKRNYYTGVEVFNYIRDNSATILNNASGKTIDCSVDTTTNVSNYLYVFDYDQYEREVLFSYKLFDKMIEFEVKPSLNRVILGQQLNGSDYYLNVANESLISVVLIAGSGTGKGVVTMNFAAGVLAAGVPVVYADYKPDMAAAFWDMERYLTQKLGRPVPILAIDGKMDKDKYGNTPVRWYDFSANIPEAVKQLDGFTYTELRIMPYIKMIMLFCLVAAYRQMNPEANGQKYVNFFDELQSVNTALGALQANIEKYSSNNSRGAKKLPPEVVDYMDKLLLFLGSLNVAVNDLLRTSGRISKALAFSLGQNITPHDWKYGEAAWGKSPFINLVSGANFRLVGGDHKPNTSATYTFANTNFAGKDRLYDDKAPKGYFAVHRGYTTPQTQGAIKMIKSYLTFNDNDVAKAVPTGDLSQLNTNTITGGFLNGFEMPERERMYYDELMMPDGVTVNAAIGFNGLIEKIISNLHAGNPTEILAEYAHAGYKLYFDAMKWSGLDYPDVESYLYDCSPESLWTYGKLRSQVPKMNSQEQGEYQDIDFEDMRRMDKLNEEYAEAQVRYEAELEEYEANPHGRTRPVFVEPEGFTAFMQQQEERDRQIDNLGSVSVTDIMENLEEERSSEQREQLINPAEQRNSTAPTSARVLEDEEDEGVGDADSSFNPDFTGQEDTPLQFGNNPIVPDMEDEEENLPVRARRGSSSNPEVETPNPTNSVDTRTGVEFRNPSNAFQDGVGNRVAGDGTQARHASPSVPHVQQREIASQYTYDKQLTLPRELFARGKVRGSLGLYTSRQVSVMMMNDIEQMMGGNHQISRIEIGRNGVIINGVHYKPTFDEFVLDNLPEVQRYRVLNGDVSDLFYFNHLKKYKNLVYLTIPDYELAEGRLRDELPLHPTYPWERVFKLFKKLQRLEVGGDTYDRNDVQREVVDNNGNRSTPPAIVNRENEQGYDFQDTLADRITGLFGFTKRATKGTRNYVERKTPLRVVKNATLATAATYGVLTIASVFGGWGLLLGAFAGYGAYKEHKKRGGADNQHVPYSNYGRTHQNDSSEESFDEDERPQQRRRGANRR